MEKQLNAAEDIFPVNGATNKETVTFTPFQISLKRYTGIILFLIINEAFW